MSITCVIHTIYRCSKLTEEAIIYNMNLDEATIKLAGLVTTIAEAGALVSGDCWALAGKLNERLGWPIIVLSDVDGIPIHMTVEAPDGRLLDAEALWSRDDFIRAWENEYESINPDGNIDNTMGRYHIGCWTGFHTGEPQFARYNDLASTGWAVSYETGRLFPEVDVDAVASKIIKFLHLSVPGEHHVCCKYNAVSSIVDHVDGRLAD